MGLSLAIYNSSPRAGVHWVARAVSGLSTAPVLAVVRRGRVVIRMKYAQYDLDRRLVDKDIH